jgi:hypothetical protein
MVTELKKLETGVRAPLLEREQVIQTYEDVCAGRRRRFPNNFFHGREGRRRAAVITRYLLEDKLGVPVNEIPKTIHKKLFYENGLTWMLGSCFDWSPYRAIDNAYPERFHKWQFNVKGMWQGPDRYHLAAQATRWMIEEIEGCPVCDIPKNISATTFGKHNLRGMLSVCFKGSFFRAIENAYPGRFHPWEFRNVPKNFWQGEQGLANARRATRWLCEEVLRVPRERVFQDVTYHLFREHGLGGMLTGCFNGSSIQALHNAYPDLMVPKHPKRKPRRRRSIEPVKLTNA